MKKESKLIDRRIIIDESVVVVGVNEDTGFINLTKQDETLTVRMTPDELKGVYDAIGEILNNKLTTHTGISIQSSGTNPYINVKATNGGSKSVFDYNPKENIFSI
jgi:hypothetical protein